METLHNIELGWMVALQSLRSPFLDQFFILLNFFDTSTFYFLLIPCIWFLYDRKCGALVLFLMLFSTLLNHDIKLFFHEPRPFKILPELAVIHVKGYSFPSGAAQV